MVVPKDLVEMPPEEIENFLRTRRWFESKYFKGVYSNSAEYIEKRDGLTERLQDYMLEGVRARIKKTQKLLEQYRRNPLVPEDMKKALEGLENELEKIPEKVKQNYEIFRISSGGFRDPELKEGQEALTVIYPYDAFDELLSRKFRTPGTVQAEAAMVIYQRGLKEVKVYIVVGDARPAKYKLDKPYATPVRTSQRSVYIRYVRGPGGMWRLAEKVEGEEAVVEKIAETTGKDMGYSIADTLLKDIEEQLNIIVGVAAFFNAAGLWDSSQQYRNPFNAGFRPDSGNGKGGRTFRDDYIN